MEATVEERSEVGRTRVGGRAKRVGRVLRANMDDLESVENEKREREG